MVHAVLAGITLSQMCHTLPTKLNLVILSQALSGGLFAFYKVDQFSQVFNLGGIRRDGGGNRYHGYALTWEFPSQPSKTELLPRGNIVSA